MAGASVDKMPGATLPASRGSLTADELHELQQCRKIISFRDAILSGTHPSLSNQGRVAVKDAKASGDSIAHLSSDLARTQTAPSSNHKSSEAMLNNFQAGNIGSFLSNSHHSAAGAGSGSGAAAAVPTLPGLGNFGRGSGSAASGPPSSKPASASKADINPVLLEKSDTLIQAEIQLQRNRLERALKDELDQRRQAMKAQSQAFEQLADFDLANVLSRALALVQSAAAPSADANVAANSSPASDSFDDNTFYSSQHDTPDSHQLSRVRSLSDNMDTGDDDSVYEPELEPPLLQSTAPLLDSRIETGVQTSTPGDAHRVPQPSTRPITTIPSPRLSSTAVCTVPAHAYIPPRPALEDPSSSNGHSTNMISSQESPAVSRPGPSTNIGAGQAVGRGFQGVNHAFFNESLGRMESTVVRAHNLSPIAPQPAHVSPLAVARQPPLLVAETNVPQVAPAAQVTALRKDPPNASSPESSPQGNRANDKRKNKKKNKRKAERLAAEVPASPYIKPEPRSPSPLGAPSSYARPNKRQKQAQKQMQELSYDETRYEQMTGESHAGRYSIRPQDERDASSLMRTADVQPHPASHPAASTVHRYGREYYANSSELPGPPTSQQRMSPQVYAFQYGGVDARPLRSVSSAMAEPPRREARTYYRDSHEAYSTIMRPTELDRPGSPTMRAQPSPMIMGPPRAPPPPARVVVDDYGREYFEPPRQSVIHQSVGPPTRLGEQDIIYERAPPRSASRRPGPEYFEEGGILYRRASPSYAVQRRVITQPPPTEFVPPAHHGLRQGEYSVRPLPPNSEDYTTRSASARPPEIRRYEMPVEPMRLQSVRPDAAAHDYASGLHPEPRREYFEPPARGYSVRPAEHQPIVRREYSVRPVERYYDPPVQGGDGISYIERPREEPQEIIYADNARANTYR